MSSSAAAVELVRSKGETYFFPDPAGFVRCVHFAPLGSSVSVPGLETSTGSTAEWDGNYPTASATHFVVPLGTQFLVEASFAGVELYYTGWGPQRARKLLKCSGPCCVGRTLRIDGETRPDLAPDSVVCCKKCDRVWHADCSRDANENGICDGCGERLSRTIDLSWPTA